MSSSKSSEGSAPRIIIAGLKGGSGKTILALGLIRSLTKGRQLTVQPFKKGPDYIDAEWLRSAAGRECYNLDQFLMSSNTILRSFTERSQGADLSVIEGNRGLYDGMDVHGSCSTAELAKLLKCPVILVMDVTKTTRTAAALVLGCRNLDPEVEIAGVVLNQVGGPRHRRIVSRAVEEFAGLPVLVAIPRLKSDPLPMRHLGLTPAFEFQESERALDELAAVVEQNVDLEQIASRAAAASSLPGWKDQGSRPQPETVSETIFDMRPLQGSDRPRVGILRDPAFQFYYPENLEALERAGLELVFLNALSDSRLPELHALYIGGGFPETQADALSSNRDFVSELAALIEGGLPVYAECGGLMYLGRAIVWKDKTYPMLGCLAWDFVVGRRPVGHGYSIIQVDRQNPFYPEGTEIRGHEFHYSRPVAADGAHDEKMGRLTCRVVRGHGFKDGREGICRKNIFGTYTHIHALERPDWARAIAAAAARYRAGSG